MIINKLRKMSISALALVTVLSPIYSGGSVLAATPEEDITLDLQTKTNVDVVVSVGNTKLDLSTFSSSLYGKLAAEGVDTSKVNITAVETVSQNLQNSFSWVNDVSSSIGSINIGSNGSVIQMYGNPSYPGFNKIYTNVVDNGIKTQDMSFNYSLNYGDSFDGAGPLINTEVGSNGLLNGYALMLRQNGNAEVYQLTNWRSRDEIIGGSSGTKRLIGTIPMGNSGQFTVRTEKDKLTVLNRNNQSVIGSVALPSHFGWGFGFFGDHYSHGCSRIGEFSLTNVALAQTMAKEFTEVIRIPEWRDNSARVMVHVDEQSVPNFNDPLALGEIIPRLSNENINFLTYGNSANKAQFEKVIQMNNGNGAFYDISNYNNALTSTAKYIKALVDKEGKGGQYVLVGKPIEVNVNPSSLKKNTATPEFPNGRWKIDHDYTYFDNNTGQAGWANQYQKDLVMSFEKPGRYEVSFGNSHPEPRYIYAHREPLAKFSVSFSGTSGVIPLNYNDRSFDPDRESSADKGIKAREWKWRKTDSAVWNTGKLTSITSGENYIVQLRVQDEYGVWSSAVQKYVTTNASTSIVPIADFNVTPSDVTRYETLKYDDYSYTPNGIALKTRTWKVYDPSGRIIHNSSSPLTSFAGKELGKYKVTLQVTNNSNVESEEFARFVNVVKDSHAPEAIINPTLKDWTNIDYSISVELNDVGGSGFKSQQYAFTTSQTFPSSGLSSPSSSNKFTVPVNKDGVYYLHIKSDDNEGNVMTRTSGPYKLDKTAPVKPQINLSETKWTAPVVYFDLVSGGDGVGSGVREMQYRINGGSWKVYTNRVNIPEDLAGKITIDARAIDGVGNISTISNAVALIDDKDPIINGVKVVNKGNNVNLEVDAVDNESGIMSPGYKYYQKIVGVDTAFKDFGDWTDSSSVVLPTKPSSTKYIYKAEVRDFNKHNTTSDEVAYVSAPVVSFAGVKEGDFDNTITVDLDNSIGKDVKVKVFREGTYVALIESGNTFKDLGLDYERDYNYTLVAYTDFNGKEILSEETPVKVTIGKPTLEMSLDNKQYYKTIFSPEFSVTGNVVYRKGGVINLGLFSGKTEVTNTKVSVLPYAKVKWNLVGKQNTSSNTDYTVKADLDGYENTGLYGREFKVKVAEKLPVVKSVSDKSNYYK